MESRGRRHLTFLPPADAQRFRIMVGAASDLQSEGPLQFECAGGGGIVGQVYTLAECEDLAGLKIDYSRVRVVLQGESVPSLSLTPGTLEVATIEGDCNTTLGQLLNQCYSAVHNISRALPDSRDLVVVLDQLQEIGKQLSFVSLLQSRGRKLGCGKGGGFQYAPDNMLNAVLLADNLKDIGQLKSTVEALVLSPSLMEHLSKQPMQVPSQATLYRFRLLVDLASMVYSRRVYFSASKSWTCHLRADASPLYGKDYFVCEIDHINLECITNTTTMREMKDLIARRILPVQLVGLRASTAVHKAFRLSLALAADTESPNMTLIRAYSIAFDMGTESKLFVSPASTSSEKNKEDATGLVACDNNGCQPLDMILPTKVPSNLTEDDMQDVSRMCPRALPIGDADHASSLA